MTSLFGFEIEPTGEKWLAKQKFCDDCIHLKFTEGEQNEMYLETGRRVRHWCKIYQTRIIHAGQHPRLPRPGFCYRYENEIPFPFQSKG